MPAPVSDSGHPIAASPKVRDLFNKAIGGTFYRQMLSALRSSTGNAAYLDGGQTEKIFQSQFDELIIERLSERNGNVFADKLVEQWERLQNARFQSAELKAGAERAAASEIEANQPAGEDVAVPSPGSVFSGEA